MAPASKKPFETVDPNELKVRPPRTSGSILLVHLALSSIRANSRESAPLTPGIDPNSPTSPTSTQLSVPTAIVPIDPVELGQLLVDDSDSDDELELRPHNKSTSTLQLVRVHIRRHLSQDSLSRRRARSAVGTSHEEIERRAELKRLMRKRIQEELRTEESQETTQSDISSNHRERAPSVDFLPGGGPRDNLEFSVTEDSKQETQCMSPLDSNLLTSLGGNTSDLTENEHPGQRRASCPDAKPKPARQNVVKERSSLPQMPGSPELVPKRSLSVHDASSLGSWRLSYSADQLDKLLGYGDRRRPSRDNGSLQRLSLSLSSGPASPSTAFPLSSLSHSTSGFLSSPARPGTPGNETPTRAPVDQSPLSTWLRSQGLRSSSPSVSGVRTSEEEPEGSIKQAEIVYLRRCSSVQHPTAPETDLPRPEIVHLYDMDIHRQLATRAFNTPEGSVGQPSMGKGYKERSKGKGSCSDPVPELPETAYNDSESRSTAKANTHNDSPGLGATQSSSVYPSSGNSAEPSPGTSTHHVPDWTLNRKGKYPFTTPDLSWIEKIGNPHIPTESGGSSRLTPVASSLDGVVSPQTSPVASPFSSSTSPSQTLTVRDARQSEKGIGRFRLGHGAPATLIARFHKRSDHPPASTENNKPSLLARLHLTFPRRAKLSPRSFDGSLDEPERLPPINNFFGAATSRPSSRTSDKKDLSPLSSSLLGLSDCQDSTAKLWGRAIREEARLRNARYRGHGRRSSLPEEDLYKKSHDAVYTLKHHSSFLAEYKFAPYEATDRSPMLAPTPSPLSGSLRTAHDSPPLCELKQVASLEPNASLASNKSHARQFSGIPDSWARFPSHNRTERNNATSDKYHAVSTEIATRIGSESDDPERSIDQASVRTPGSGRQTLPGKLGKVFKSGFGKLLSSKASSTAGSPKSSKSVGNISDRYKRGLEYPELEILPDEAGYRELSALGHEIEHMKGLPRALSPVTLQDDQSIALSPKMASLLHIDGTADLMSPVTPAPSHARDSTTISTDRFVTPLSSMSLNHDNSSFHSYPHSRPLSRIVAPFSGEALAETSSDLDSVKSDTVLSKNNG
ncbi:hypothetical protein OQA88_12008 [Cercophora sp. LCS_1]